MIRNSKFDFGIIFCVLLEIGINFWVMTIPKCYNPLYVKTYVFVEKTTEKINIKGSIKEIPKEHLVSYHTPSVRLQKPKWKHIKFIKRGINYSMNSVIPRVPGNANFLGGYDPALEDDMNNNYWNYSASYVHMKNMYCTYSGAFITDSNFEYIDLEKNPNINFIHDHPNGTCIKSYDYAITAGHTQIYQFGHFMHDVVMVMMLFPDDILKNSYIIINSGALSYCEGLIAIGVDKWQIIGLKSGEYVHCRNLYAAVDPIPHMSHYGLLCIKLSNKLRNYYSVEHVVPSRYLFMNRKINRGRRIGNMEDIVLAANKKYENKYYFEYVEDDETLKGSSILWSSARFMFCPTGSNCVKELFMAPNTIIVISLRDLLDISHSIRAASHGVFALLFRIVGYPHYSNKVAICNIDLGLKAVSLAIRCLELGHFDPDADYQ